MILITHTDVANALRKAEVTIASHHFENGDIKYITYLPFRQKYEVTYLKGGVKPKVITETNRYRAILAYNTLEP